MTDGTTNMAGAPRSTKADIEKLQLLVLSTDGVVDLKPIIAYTMRHTGATFREIGDVFGVSHQMARNYYEQAKVDVR